MPRLPPSLLWRANRINPYLPRLLRECRDLESAQNELRWIREYVQSLEDSGSQKQGATSLDRLRSESRLRRMVGERSRGKPLQYILGDQPFGNLEILCRKGVLIPRDDTEPYTTRTARWIVTNFLSKDDMTMYAVGSEGIWRGERPLRILDLCTGTGCISLLLHSILVPYFPKVQIVGVDISTQALDLARENLAHNIAKGNLAPRASDEVHFVQADMLKELHSETDTTSSNAGTDIPDLDTVLSQFSPDSKWDVIISNPPYIAPESYNNGTTKRSVRLYEPKLALVPPPVTTLSEHPITPQERLERKDRSSLNLTSNENAARLRGDSFYPRIIGLAVRYHASLTVVECGDLNQALRVRNLMQQCGRTHRNINRKLYRTMAAEWLFYEPEDDVHVPLPSLLHLAEKQEREVNYDAWKGSVAVIMTRETIRGKD